MQTNLETRVQIQVFPDGTRIETDANTKTTVTLFPDGKQVTVFDDTTQLTLFPDGTSRQVSPNGTVVTVDADGTKTQSNPDGSSIVVYKDGRKVRTLPNGNKIESFPNGVSRQIKVSNPEFGERTNLESNEEEMKQQSEQKSNNETKEGDLTPTSTFRRSNTESDSLPALSRSPTEASLSRGSPKGSDEDDEDEEEEEVGIKVSLSMASMVTALDGHRRNKSTIVYLKDLSSVQVIRLLQEWNFNVFRKDFATLAVTGKMLHDLESVSDPMLASAPSSLRKEFFYRLQQAKANGLAESTAKAIESTGNKMRRVRGTKWCRFSACIRNVHAFVSLTVRNSLSTAGAWEQDQFREQCSGQVQVDVGKQLRRREHSHVGEEGRVH